MPLKKTAYPMSVQYIFLYNQRALPMIRSTSLDSILYSCTVSIEPIEPHRGRDY